ncbi:MAG: SGNH/GDSL hydrolase family protein [Muribaculaceae bacterium]|nr:SGNH/GDSL hydrolase family protein [Muribaculaceae bacterium]
MNRKQFDKWTARIALLTLLLTAVPVFCSMQHSSEQPDWTTAPQASAASFQQSTQTESTPVVKKVLFIGDSMTGWMAERFNAYADNNNFEVATIVWDGSTISKWANSPNLSKIISEQAPDAIIVSLGMNELFEANPQNRLKESVDKLKEKFGDIPFLWIGPPSWPGHSEGEVLNKWLLSELGNEHFFRSFDLTIPRQSKSNPHPTRNGIEEWIDEVAAWIPGNSALNFESMNPPESGKFSRSKTFIYKRMKENL